MSELQTSVYKFSNGHTIPIVGFGTWLSTAGVVEEAVKKAITTGYRHIDTAYAYFNEQEVGNAIKACLSDGVVKREELFVTTKLWNTYHRADLVRKHFMEQLAMLQLDYVDLYLMHWPIGLQEGGVAFPKDADGKSLLSDADYLDTWREMEKLVDDGLVRSIGLSSFNSEQIQRILDSGNKHSISSLQIEISPYNMNTKLMEWAKNKGIVVTGFSPFGAPQRPWVKPEDRILFNEDKVKTIAKDHNRTAAQVILRWGFQRGYCIIPKSVTPERIEQNAQIFDFELSKDEMATMESFEQERACSVPWYKLSKYYPFHIEF